jgi:hypothetical protein
MSNGKAEAMEKTRSTIMPKCKSRVVTTIKWYCKAFSTNLHEDPDHYIGTTPWEKENSESIWLAEFEIVSVADNHYRRDELPALGKYLLAFALTVYGNDRLVGVADRVNRRLQRLQDAGIVSGFHSDSHRPLAYFNPDRGKNFTRKSLEVATEFFKAFDVPKFDWQQFSTFQETQFLPKDSRYWIDFTKHLKITNEDLLGMYKK